ERRSPPSQNEGRAPSSTCDGWRDEEKAREEKVDGEIPRCADSARNDGVNGWGTRQPVPGVYLADRLRRRSLQRREELEFEEFAEAFGLLTGDGDFGLFFVVHFEHEAGFEPGNDFLDVVDVDEIGAVRAPEGFGLQGVEEFVESAVVGGAFDVLGDDGDETAFDG